MFMLLFAACTAEPVVDAGDTGADETGPYDTGPYDTGDTTHSDTAETDSGGLDRDADGVPEASDCDDRDADVYPGAPERWNDTDDDCDGVVDADGTWSGSIRVAASAVYEGRRYDFALDCPFSGTRTLGVLDFVVTCTPDPDDEDAQRLLGATLTIAGDEPEVEGEAWADAVVFASANGWDSDGEGTIDWSSYDAAAVQVEMEGVSLVASGRGDVTRD